MKASNPLAFRPLPVVIICTAVYIAFSVGLIYVGSTVPPAPREDDPFNGVSLAEAYLDLQELSSAFHPYNSRHNDHVRSWLLSRIGSILDDNDVDHATVQLPDTGPSKRDDHVKSAVSKDVGSAAAVVFNDLQSNVSFSAERLGSPAMSTYFEGTNVAVYLRGEEDSHGAWWESKKRYAGSKGVLVNAHYDSVSTGYGATDDGVGVVTVLQLLRYFSKKGNQPKHGIIFLLNNGEEDFLNGARAFAQLSIASFPNRFLNLEGAGAGGRAALFRTTDTEVTRFYQGVKHPFASSTSDDGFKAGLIKSETDYRVFFGDLGMRGLDIAFLEPRSKYHTTEDDTRHTGRDSLWHMLSAAVPTMKGLAANEIDESSRADAAWFDLFGETFAVMELHTLFALQVTSLVLAPVSIILIAVALSQKDKFYLFSRYRWIGGGKARMGGLKGLFRAPMIFAVSSGCTIAVAFLIIKLNPFIVSSSPWSVWACFVSLWIFMTWFLSRFADYVRPTALHRVYSLAWLHLGSWVVAVAAAAYENRGLSSGYPMLFYQLGLSLATTLALSELFAVRKQSEFAAEQLNLPDDYYAAAPPQDGADGEVANEAEDALAGGAVDAGEEPTETTSLLRDQQQQDTTFRPQSRRTINTVSTTYLDDKPPNVYRYEQFWSSKLPSTLWVLEFLLSSLPALIFIGPVIALVNPALTQTLSDGGAFGIYIPMSILAILLVAPLQPFLHRFTYQIPIFLLFVFIGTLIYNVVAFPFSANARLKVYFAQEVDLDTGINHVMLSGASRWMMERATAELPSSAGEHFHFKRSARVGLIEARWSGLPPTVVPPPKGKLPPGVPPELGYEHWLTVNATRISSSKAGKGGRNEARIMIAGKSTRNCKLMFDPPVSSFYVEGSATDNGPFASVPDEGTNEIRLWHRDWDEPWTVQVTWKDDDDDDEKRNEGDGEGVKDDGAEEKKKKGEKGGKGLDGRAVCMWNEDERQPDGGIPALAEIRTYAPIWIIPTKNGDGLVEGSKRFLV